MLSSLDDGSINPKQGQLSEKSAPWAIKHKDLFFSFFFFFFFFGGGGGVWCGEGEGCDDYLQVA